MGIRHARVQILALLAEAMLRPALLLAAAVLLMGAAPAAKPPAPKAAAAKPPAPKAAAPAGFDARDPNALVAVLTAAGAKTQMGKPQDDGVLVAVTSVAANFSVQFVGCDVHGRACKAAVFDDPEAGSPTLPQINSFNQSSALCRGYQDRAGRPHVVYSATLFTDTTRAQVVQQLGAWQGCIADFRQFAKDPVAYLSAAP
jgi:hypothetical protein